MLTLLVNNSNLKHINFGTQYPSAHGVLHLIVSFVGETTGQIGEYIGLLYRGTEKLARRKTYAQALPYLDRLDYVSMMAQEHCYSLTIERLLGREVPERAQNYTCASMPILTAVRSMNTGSFLTTPILDTWIAPIHIVLICVGSRYILKNRVRAINAARYFRAEWQKRPSRPRWLLELTYRSYIYLFNPGRRMLWVMYFLLRNVMGIVPYFAWTFFISLLVYLVGSFPVMAYSKPDGLFRKRFLILMPAWLIILTLFYDWGYLPYTIALPFFLQSIGLPTTARICMIPGLILLNGDATPVVDVTTGAGTARAGSSPVVRGPVSFAKALFDGAVVGLTAKWVHDEVFPISPKPGTPAAYYRSITTQYRSSIGLLKEKHDAEFIAKNNLGLAPDGGLRATCAFFNQYKLTVPQMAEFMLQKGRNGIPMMLLVGVTTYTTVSELSATKPKS